MANALRVFVSATSADLGSFRSQVTHWLLDMGLLPIVQDHFAPDDKTVSEMLKNRIGECDAVIHIVGECYGAEPRSAPAGARSRARNRLFTQVRGDARFAENAFGPSSGDFLRAMAHLAYGLAWDSDESPRSLAEAESIYKRVIPLRQSDPKFSHKDLAKLMEELGEVPAPGDPGPHSQLTP